MRTNQSVVICRILNDGPADGAWNMAVDEALLESAARDDVFSLRLYRWSEPTLSLGYFQRYADRRLHEASTSCACVRRSSGGGAILHDRELTYSLAVPPSHPLAREAPRMYQSVHGTLIALLNQLGCDAGSAPLATRRANEEESFLCFQRHVAGDVLVAGHKIVGSAQRRFHGAVLQHGSILLAASAAAPELPGVLDLCPELPDLSVRLAQWQQELPSLLGADACLGRLTAQEHHRAAEIARGKYGHVSWTQRR